MEVFCINFTRGYQMGIGELCQHPVVRPGKAPVVVFLDNKCMHHNLTLLKDFFPSLKVLSNNNTSPLPSPASRSHLCESF